MKFTNYKEQAIESTPRWLKSTYVSCMFLFKKCLGKKILNKLNEKAKKDRFYHYLRSLLAVHQIDDMIVLDVPWWTYSAIDFLEKYLASHPQLSVFEYGSGASTIWLAKRVGKVVSVEHDKYWYDQLAPKIEAFNNIEYLFIEAPNQKSEPFFRSVKAAGNFENYVKSIKKTNQIYDIIIIDGRCRVACLEFCLPYLKPNGLILFDNSNRKRYQNALHNPRLFVEKYDGRVPGSPFESETSILRIT